MVTPIKPGTAQRLGIRRPRLRLIGPISMSDMDAEAFCRAMRAAAVEPRLMHLPEGLGEYATAPSRHPMLGPATLPWWKRWLRR